MPNLAFGISFLSHLVRCDGAARVVATCHVLIGWTWRASRPNLWFSCDSNFWGHLLKFFPPFLLIPSISSPFFYNSSSFELKFSLAFRLKYAFVFLYLNFTLFHVLMVDYSEVRHLFPSVSFFFARLRAFLESSGGHYPQVDLFASRDSALRSVLTDLYPLLH